MALLNYKKFKVTVDGDSPKVNGLKYGDVVLRQYNDGAVSLYSIMYVIETGTTDVVINGVTKKEKWFIGALLEGDEPSSGENLDFSRITSISDEDRMGAIYMTSISSDAPYIDTIDSIGKDGSINYPNSFGDPLIYNKSSFSFIGEEYFSSSYLKYNGDEKRIFKLTKNSTPIIVGEKVAISIPTLKGKYSDEKILVTYKYRASGNFICNTEVSDSNGNYILMSKQITTSTEVKSNVDIFSVSNINDDSSFKIDLSQISVSGAWIEISDINIIPIFSLSRWYNSVKNRLGKLTGITDSVFGELKDYGGYFQRLYATKDINIAGTLTAGDANGFGSTFYAGKIHKNIFINSLSHDLGVYGKIDNSQGIPTGIGNSFILSDRSSHESHHIITYNTPEWYNSNAGKKYTFSAWIKSASGIKSVTLTENGNEPLSIQVDETWMRYSYTFAIGSDISNSYCFIDIFGADTNTGLYICGMQVELGEYASPYQPTDDTLAIENEDYGVWMTRGGIGGTIQNPLLQFTPEGDIRSKNDKFYITNDGTAYFEGSITAASGKIADWIIATNSLYRGVEKNILNSYTGAAGDITIGSNGIRGYKWRFDSDGSGALAGGKISFDADGTAKIGLWNIDENSIFSGIKQSSNDYTSSGITIHSDGAIRAKYARIDTDGKLYASSADIAGKITATLGQIGGWNINDTSITGGNTIINSNGSITNGTHWALNYDGSASFADGKIAFSSAGIGSIGGFTIGSDIIYSGESDYALGNISMQRTLDGGKFIASKDGNNYVMLYRNSDTDWGVLGALAGTNVFQLGSTNKISGWNFDSNALYTGTKALNDASNTTIANSITFWSSGAISSLNFRLGVDGKIYATNADISGKITASSGQIGAWNVDTNSIFSGTKSINDASNTTVDGSTTFWSSGAITSRYFRVGTDGKLYATSVDLQGKIVAASGSIGGWTINADSISGGSTYINSNGSITNGTLWILNADGSSSFAGGKINFTSTGEGFIGGWKINSNSIFSGTKALNDSSYTTVANSMTIWSSGAISAFNFRVGTDGKLYATNADISGIVHISQGSDGWSNIDGLQEEIDSSKDFAINLVENIGVGGTNLLINSGFTGDYNPLDLLSDTSLSPTTDLYGDQLKYWSSTGSNSVISDDLSKSKFAVSLAGTISQSVNDFILSESYIVGFKAKGTGTLSVGIGSDVKTVILAPSYQYFYLKYIATASAPQSVSFSGEAIIYDIKLERGTINTDWSYAPNDANKAEARIKAIEYVTDAIKNGSTDIIGGLILSSMIQLGNYKDGTMKNVTSGLSGMYNADDDPVFWGGGTFADAIKSVMNPSDTTGANAVITHGGRAILNDAIIRGIIYASGGEFSGKVSTAANGYRIELDPSDIYQLNMYDQLGRRCAAMGLESNSFGTIRFWGFDGETETVVARAELSVAGFRYYFTDGTSEYNFTIQQGLTNKMEITATLPLEADAPAGTLCRDVNSFVKVKI